MRNNKSDRYAVHVRYEVEALFLKINKFICMSSMVSTRSFLQEENYKVKSLVIFLLVHGFL